MELQRLYLLCSGDDEEAAEEEEEEEDLRFASLDGLSSSPRKDNSILPREDADTKGEEHRYFKGGLCI